jgi:hypothetical protein
MHENFIKYLRSFVDRLKSWSVLNMRLCITRSYTTFRGDRVARNWPKKAVSKILTEFQICDVTQIGC